MVPLKLRLRNFMTYRLLDPPLDFSGVHVACLAGPNGAGKSALLDALTWALWGQSRARSDDDLVTVGEAEMEVELEFAVGEHALPLDKTPDKRESGSGGRLSLGQAQGNLSSGQHRYRVLRKRVKPGLRKAGNSLLELQVAEDSDPASELFVPLTGNTIRATQQKIIELLRLDYQTFINSAMLLQGRADEFTLRTPGERKRVLGEVLGLSRYDAYEARARNEARQREGALAALQGEIARLEEQVRMRPDLETEQRATQQMNEQLTTLATAQEQTVTALREAQRLAGEREQRLQEAQEQAAHVAAELEDVRRRIAGLENRVEAYRGVTSRHGEIQAGLQEYQETVGRVESDTRAVQQLMTLRQEEAHWQREVASARAKLQADEQVLLERVQRLRELVTARSVLEQRLQQAAAEMASVAALEQRLVAARQEAEAAGQQITVLRHQSETMVQQGKELRAKVEQLGQPGSTGVCPLCGTELGPEGHDRIVQEYRGELERQRTVFRENEGSITRLQEAEAAFRAVAGSLEAETGRVRGKAQADEAVARQGLEAAERAAEELADKARVLKALQEALEAGRFAPEAQQALERARQAQAALDYDPQRHEALQQQLAALEPWRAEAQRLEEAGQRLPEEAAELERSRETERRWVALSDETGRRIAALEQELAQQPDRSGDLAQAETTLQQTRANLAETVQALGRVQAELERCGEQELRLQVQRQELSGQEREKSIYDELTVAFGRRGVQAMLIETALPELEDEANALLGRLTDNTLSLRLQTQRAARSGGTVETLDIVIGDESGGARSYELYSGGEAFRINFALRIALSKLLTRRAGAPLPTLIIDEGFGTQDSAGREKLVEAIGAIADDFERVLVITHIDELKDAFPVRIEVSKSAQGSRAEVVPL